MKSEALRLYLLLLSLVSATLDATTPYFSPKSQSANAPQQLLDMTMIYQIHRYSSDGIRGNFSLTPEYNRTFKHDDLTCCLIGKECLTSCDDRCKNNSIFISGSRVVDRGTSDWLADYFGLPPDFKSVIRLEPKVDNFLVNMNFFVPLGCSNMYFRIYAPVVHSRTRLGFCETIVDSGELGYDPGYFDSVEIPRENLLTSFEEFMGKEQVPTLINTTFRPLEKAKWLSKLCNRLNKTGLSDTMVFLGWHALHSDCYHLSIAALGIIPTGNRPQANFFFEPIIGNGKHGGVGGALSAHYLFWEDECNDSSFGIYMYGWAAHLFKTRQCRTFDLNTSCNSRYMLAEKITPPVGSTLWANPVEGDQPNSMQPNAQFKSVFTPIANITTRTVKVDVAAYGEASVLLNYTNNGLSFDIGYNFWGRSCEKITNDSHCCPNPLLLEQWALKGDSHVFGYSGTGPTCPTGIVSPTAPCLDLPIPLSGTQSDATIHSGLNNFVGPNPDDGGIGGIRPTRNPGVDNDQFARLVQGADPDASILDRFSASGGLQTKTSFEPIVITEADLDMCSAQTKGRSHAVFAHVGYAWLYEECWVPYVGIGGRAEWAKQEKQCKDNQEDSCSQNSTDSCSPCNNNSKKDCRFCAASQWSLWVKTGITFH